MTLSLSDTRVLNTLRLTSPQDLCANLPASEPASSVVLEARESIREVLAGRDPRPIVIVGPCSIHDPRAALDYASRLAAVREQLEDRLLVLMRVYFEKPRTTVGWKGLINDPDLNNSFDMAKGLRTARSLLIEINELRIPVATEILEPFTPQYLGDLLAWVAVGARTTESQTHRQMASGLSAPVGFKNSTDGNLQIAIDAMRSAASPHRFLGIDRAGHAAMIETAGNPHTHVILRGGSDGTNYGADAVLEAGSMLDEVGLEPLIMIDCSHANSGKKHQRQAAVFRDALDQIRARKRDSGLRAPKIIGLMLESHLEAGRQDLPEDRSALRYGVSITDACMDWETTRALLEEGHRALG